MAATKPVAPALTTTVVVVEVAYTIVAPVSRAVAALPGVSRTLGALPKVLLRVMVATTAAAVGSVPVVTLIIKPISEAPVSETVGPVPAPAPAAMVGAPPIPIMRFVLMRPFTPSSIKFAPVEFVAAANIEAPKAHHVVCFLRLISSMLPSKPDDGVNMRLAAPATASIYCV